MSDNTGIGARFMRRHCGPFPMPHQVAIAATELSKTYVVPFTRRRVEALRGLTLEVAAGTTFGLLGPNGAGKTTFVKILLGMTRPSSGKATMLGKAVGDYRARRHVGYLPEGGRFPPYHTGLSLLELHGHLAGLHGKSLRKRVDALLELVSMTSWRDVRLSRYSKGMVQRIGLAQAMLAEPELLMLDEPTDGVDPVGRAQIRDVLDRLNAQGVTIFLNSHILAEVELFCRHVAILHRGVLELQGDIASLTRSSGFQLRWREPDDAATSDSQQDFADLASLNAAVDVLRGRGAIINRIEPRQSSLEQVFLQAVNGSKGQAPETSGQSQTGSEESFDG